MNILLAGFSYPYGVSSIRVSAKDGIVSGLVRNYNIDKYGVCVEDLPFIDSPEICEKLFMYRYPNAYRHVVDDAVPQGESPALTVMYVLKELLESSEIYNALLDVQTQDDLYEGLFPNHIDIITLGGSPKILLGGDIDEIILPEELVDIRSNKKDFIKTRDSIIELLMKRPKPAKENPVPNDSKMFGVSKESIEQLKEALKTKSKPQRLRSPKPKRINKIQEEPDLIESEPNPNFRDAMRYYTYRDPFSTATVTTSTSYTIADDTYTKGFKIAED